MYKSVIATLFAALIAGRGSAQNAQPEMADALRADGKIYVVVLVLATIFAGIFLYLIRLDRKVSQLENKK